MQKKLLFLVPVMFLFVVTGAFVYNKKTHRADEVALGSSTTRTYENNSTGFCFKYPNTFSLTDVSDATKDAYSLNLLLQSPRAKNDLDPRSPYNQMHVVTNSMQVDSLEKYVTQDQSSANTTQREVVTINGLQGIKTKGRDSFAGSPIESVYVLLPVSSSSGGTVVSATYYASTSYSNDFAGIVESIKTKKTGVGCE